MVVLEMDLIWSVSLSVFFSNCIWPFVLILLSFIPLFLFFPLLPFSLSLSLDGGAEVDADCAAAVYAKLAVSISDAGIQGIERERE